VTSVEAEIRRLQAAAGEKWIVVPYDSVTARHKIRWLEPDPAHYRKFPELDDVADELAAWLPIGKVGRECVVAEKKPPHRVAVFMEKLWPVAPSLDHFFREVVLGKGDKTPAQRLERARKDAIKLESRGSAEEGAKLLATALEGYRIDPDPERDTVEDIEEHAAEAWNSLGVIAQTAGDRASSIAAYLHALAWGSSLAAANLVSLHLDTKRYAEAVEWGQEHLARHAGKIDFEDEAAVRAGVVVALWLSGRSADAETTLTAWAKTAAPSRRKEQKTALLTELEERALASYAKTVTSLLK
jgi:hypothetical protein